MEKPWALAMNEQILFLRASSIVEPTALAVEEPMV
jgi:hypothetical protein